MQSTTSEHPEPTGSNTTTNEKTRIIPTKEGSNAHDERNRDFLVRITALLMGLVFISYIITRDIDVLLGTTIIGIATSFIFPYYFPRKRE